MICHWMKFQPSTEMGLRIQARNPWRVRSQTSVVVSDTSLLRHQWKATMNTTGFMRPELCHLSRRG